MDTAEIIIRVPKRWKEELERMAKEADYQSLNAMLLECLEMDFCLPHESDDH